MKMLIGLFSVALSFSALASSVDTKTFVYDGSQNSVELLLKAEKTHTEYRLEEVETTCYRREFAGYNTFCPGGGYGPGRGPYPGPRGPGYPRGPMPGGSRCYHDPVYRQVPYLCKQTISIPFEVKDYDVDARVIVDVTKLSPESTPGEILKATLRGDVLTFEAFGSKKFFIVNKKQDIRSGMSGSVKMIDALLVAELVEAGPVLRAMNMSDISMSNGVLNFNIGHVDSRDNLGFALKIVRKKTFGSDTVLLDRELSESEVEVDTTATGAEAGVSVAHLGVNLTKGKYSLTAKAFAKFEGRLMNSSQFDELSASRTLIYSTR
jgi:hypothetical protein